MASSGLTRTKEDSGSEWDGRDESRSELFPPVSHNDYNGIFRYVYTSVYARAQYTCPESPLTIGTESQKDTKRSPELPTHDQCTSNSRR